MGTLILLAAGAAFAWVVPFPVFTAKALEVWRSIGDKLKPVLHIG